MSAAVLALVLGLGIPPMEGPELKSKSCEELCTSVVARCRGVCDHAGEKMPDCPKKCEDAKSRCANLCEKRRSRKPKPR